jgi:hypothetical protein
MDEHDEEEKTRLIRRLKSGAAESDPDAGITHATRVLPSESDVDDGMTRLVGPAGRSSGEDPAPDCETDAGAADPVVGWLVVLEGPGRGNARRLGYGQNSLGRDRAERASLNFGDSSISRTKHCFVIYEPRKRQFFLRPGDGANLTYLDGELVSETVPLAANQIIEIGITKLRFVALCGPDFDWEAGPPAEVQ